jgi:hypothetical protein
VGYLGGVAYRVLEILAFMLALFNQPLYIVSSFDGFEVFHVGT